MTDHETLAVAVTYAALALAGSAMLARLSRWAESDDGKRFAVEIGNAIEGATR